MQLKPPTLVRDYEYVFHADPALDTDAEDFVQRYNEANESGSWDNVPLRDGRKPIVWKLSHLRGIPKFKIQDLLNDDIRNGRTQPSFVTLYHAARFALKAVSGLAEHNGMPVDDFPRFADAEWGRAMSVPPELMDRLSEIELDGEVVGDTLVREIGGTALMRVLPGKR